MTADCAYQCGKSLSSTLLHYRLQNPAELRDRQADLLKNMGIEKQLDHDQIGHKDLSDIHMLDLDELQFIWQELSRYRETIRSKNCQLSHTRCLKCGIVPHKSIYEDPMQYLGTRKCDQKGMEFDNIIDHQVYSSLFRALNHQIQYTNGHGSRCSQQVPLIDDFRAFITDDDATLPPQVNHNSICFGLYLLKTTFQEFHEQMFVNEKLNLNTAGSICHTKSGMGRLPRLHALKLCSDFSKATKTTLESPNVPCSCMKIHGSMLLTHLADSASIFEGFVRTVNFDLLHQNPWISGTHAARNLARASDCGSMLWHYGYFVGTVLHVYNALTQTKLSESSSMPILEALCDIYKDSLFLGRRSTHNVHSCWQRWTGAKIMPKHHREQIVTDGIEKKWHLCAVHDKSHGGDTESRSFAPKRVSLFSLLAGGKSIFDNNITTCIYLDRQKPRKVSFAIA